MRMLRAADQTTRAAQSPDPDGRRADSNRGITRLPTTCQRLISGVLAWSPLRSQAVRFAVNSRFPYCGGGGPAQSFGSRLGLDAPIQGVVITHATRPTDNRHLRQRLARAARHRVQGAPIPKPLGNIVLGSSDLPCGRTTASGTPLDNFFENPCATW